MKKTCMISQPCGIGDILFIQKIVRHHADLGYHVVAPIFEQYAWLRYYLEPHPDIEYPLIATNGAEFRGDFKFAAPFLELGGKSSTVTDPANAIFASPIAYNGVDPETGFVFLALSSSYHWRGEKMMSSKYTYAGVDVSDWPDHVHLKRRPEVERELYYDVLGLKDGDAYTLVNGKTSGTHVDFDVPGETVRLREIEGFTLIDWSLVIERAAQIVTVDTSLVILAEILKQHKPLHMISRYTPPTFDPIEDVLTLDWNLALTPADLKVRTGNGGKARRETPFLATTYGMKKTLFICQPFGIGDVLYVQKIILHYAAQGFHIVVPILQSMAWLRYYLLPHPDVEYPVITPWRGQWSGNFKFADMFISIYIDSLFNEDKTKYTTPIIFNNGDAETGFTLLPLCASFEWPGKKLMPAKYEFVGLDFADWVDHVHYKRRPHVERELYYDVLGLRDNSRYTLVNGKSSRSALPITVPGDIVNLAVIDGFTLFDWFMVIEKAVQIVTIDTSLVLLAEILKVKKPLYMISRYHPPSFEEIKDILSLDWKLVPTVAELDVPAAA